jgi:hypothetical protein
MNTVPGQPSARTPAAAVADDLIIDLQPQFVMVPFADLQAIERAIGGVSRARTIGFAAELRRLAANQGRGGDGSFLVTSRVALQDEVGISRSKANEYLKRLAAARTITISQLRFHPDSEDGETVRIDFRVNRPPFAQVSGPALLLMRRGERGMNYIGRLGLYVTLKRICFEQRDKHSNRFAVISRPRLAEATGATTEWVTYMGQALEECGVVRREEQRSAAKQNITMRWWLLSVTDDDLRAALADDRAVADEADGDLGRNTEPPPDEKERTAGRETTHDPDEKERTAGRETAHAPDEEPADPERISTTGPGRISPGEQGGNSASYARAHDPLSENCLTDKRSPSAVANSVEVDGKGKVILVSPDATPDCLAICQTFARWLVVDTSPAVLDSPGSWRSAQAAWLKAAQEVLDAGYAPERFGQILEDLSDDYKVGDRLHRLPDVPRQIHELAKRAAHRRRANTNRASATSDEGFSSAFAQIKSLVLEHGRDGFEDARDALDQLGPRHRRFVEKAGWRKICGATSFHEAELRRIWQEMPAEGDT